VSFSLEAEDTAMRLAAVQMSRIALGLPAESKVRRQMMQNARWWRLSAVHPSTTGHQLGELSVSAWPLAGMAGG
jgi:hypothetical protein